MMGRNLRNRAGLIMDTNLLVLYIVGLHDPDRIDQFKRTKGAYSVDDFYLLVRLIEQFGGFSTTPNILTEVSNLIEGVRYNDIPLLSLLRSKVAYREERYEVSKLIFDDENSALEKFGLSDAVLYALARQNYVVLTVDAPLSAFLESKNLPVINFNHLRSSSLLS